MIFLDSKSIRVVWLLLFGTIFFACSTPSSKPFSSKPLKLSSPAATQGSTASEAFLSIQGPKILRYLPRSVFLLGIAKDPKALVTKWKSTETLKEYQEYLDFSALMQNHIGFHLFEPETWSSIGIDNHAPAGMALIVVPTVVIGFFVELENKELFIKNLENVGQNKEIGPLTKQSLPQATLYTFGKARHANLIIQNKTAIFLFVDRQSHKEDIIASFISTKKHNSLASDASFIKALSDTGFKGDITLYFGAKEFARQLSAELSTGHYQPYNNDSLDRLERKIEDAFPSRTTNSPEELAANEENLAKLEEQLERWLQSNQKAKRGLKATLALIQAFIGDLGSFALAIDFQSAGSQPSVAQLQGQFHPHPGSIPDRLFTGPTRAFTLPQKLQAEPLAMASGHFSLPAIQEIIEHFAQSKDMTIKELNQGLKDKMGQNLSELLAHLQGEASIALTMNLQSFQSNQYKRLGNLLNIQAMARLANPLQTQKQLDYLVHHSPLKEFKAKQKGKNILLVSGIADNQLRIAVEGDFLVLKSALDSSYRPKYHPEEQALLTKTDSHAHLVLNPALAAWTLFARPEKRYGSARVFLSKQEEIDKAHAIEKKLEPLYAKDKDLRFHKIVEQLQNGRITMAIQHQQKKLGPKKSDSKKPDSKKPNSKKPNPNKIELWGVLIGSKPTLGQSVQTMLEAITPQLEGLRTPTKSTQKSPKTIEFLKLQKEITELQTELRKI